MSQSMCVCVYIPLPLPLPQSPCDDKRHVEIWPPHKNCTRLPSLLILGPQKSGSTALHSFLKLHPLVLSNTDTERHFEEVQFFSDDSLYLNGIEWYGGREAPGLGGGGGGGPRVGEGGGGGGGEAPGLGKGGGGGTRVGEGGGGGPRVGGRVEGEGGTRREAMEGEELGLGGATCTCTCSPCEGETGNERWKVVNEQVISIRVHACTCTCTFIFLSFCSLNMKYRMKWNVAMRPQNSSICICTC